MIITSVKEWAFQKLFNAISVGCKTVSPENKKQRIDICKQCEFYGKVDVGIELDGCTICGCPSITKAGLKTIPRLFKGKPLTIQELLQIKFDLQDVEYETITCPHPTENKWKIVDDNFQ